MAVTDAMRMGVRRQGFMQPFPSPAEQFRVIESQSQGCFRSATRERIWLPALSAAPDLAREFQLLRRAQRIAVNVLRWEMDSLTRSGAIYEVQAGTGIFVLREEFNSDEFGLRLDGSEEWRA
jgi:CRISPR-associated endonuclease/helicase Cas3